MALSNEQLLKIIGYLTNKLMADPQRALTFFTEAQRQAIWDDYKATRTAEIDDQIATLNTEKTALG